MTKENPIQPAGSLAQNRGNPLIGLKRIREAARRDRRQRFTSLMHHITPELLIESYYALKKDARAGVDDETWHKYSERSTARLEKLHEGIQSGKYQAKPSKRIYIPKGDSEERPIGIASLEDKIVQKAVVRILEQIYEVDFLGFSYGFRPGRSPHNALDAISVGIHNKRIGHILDADIRQFFDNLSHKWLIKFLEHRIADKRMIRLIRKWLRAGVSEEGEWSPTKVGTPQGAVISPLLANIFMHYALDLWVHQWRRRYARGNVIIVRYADDFVVGFQYQREAEQFQKELKVRLAKFNLELHETKTKLIEFGRFANQNRRDRGEGKAETFDFLGFTHICSKTRKNKKFTIRRKPIAKRMRKTLKKIRKVLLKTRHSPVAEQGKWLRSVVQGYFNYFAVPGTAEPLNSFRTQIRKHWIYALRHRSHKARKLTWKKMAKLDKTWIPRFRIMHPYPDQRLRV